MLRFGLFEDVSAVGAVVELVITHDGAGRLASFVKAAGLASHTPEVVEALLKLCCTHDAAMNSESLARFISENLAPSLELRHVESAARNLIEIFSQMLVVLSDDATTPSCDHRDLAIALLPAQCLGKSTILGHAWRLASTTSSNSVVHGNDASTPVRLPRAGVWRVLRALLSLLLITCDESAGGDHTGSSEGLGTRAQRLARVASEAAIEATTALFSHPSLPPGAEGITLDELAAVYNAASGDGSDGLSCLGWLELVNLGKWLIPAEEVQALRAERAYLGTRGSQPQEQPSRVRVSASPAPSTVLLFAVDPCPTPVVVDYPLAGRHPAREGAQGSGEPLHLRLTASACHVARLLTSSLLLDAPLQHLVETARGLQLQGRQPVDMPTYGQLASCVTPRGFDAGSDGVRALWTTLLSRSFVLLASADNGISPLSACAALAVFARGSKSEKLAALFEALGADVDAGFSATYASSGAWGKPRRGVSSSQLGEVMRGLHAMFCALASVGAEADFLDPVAANATATVVSVSQLGLEVAFASATCGHDMHAAIEAHSASKRGAPATPGPDNLVTFSQLSSWYNSAQRSLAASPSLELLAIHRAQDLPGAEVDEGADDRMGRLVAALLAHEDTPAAALTSGSVAWLVGGAERGFQRLKSPPSSKGAVIEPTYQSWSPKGSQGREPGAAQLPVDTTQFTGYTERTDAVADLRDAVGAVSNREAHAREFDAVAHAVQRSAHDSEGAGDDQARGEDSDVVFGFELPVTVTIGGEPAGAVMRISESDVRAYHDLRASAGLAAVTLDVMTAALREEADAAGRITLESVLSLPQRLRVSWEDKENAAPPAEPAVAGLSRVFALCDPRGTGHAAVADVSTALSVLCACRRREGKSGKLAALWDTWRTPSCPRDAHALDQRGLQCALQGTLTGLLAVSTLDGVSRDDTATAAGVAHRASSALAAMAFSHRGATVSSPARSPFSHAPPPPLLPFDAFAGLYDGPLGHALGWLELLDPAKWPLPQPEPVQVSTHAAEPSPAAGSTRTVGLSPRPAAAPAPVPDEAVAASPEMVGGGVEETDNSDAVYVSPLCGAPLGSRLPHVVIVSTDVGQLRGLLAAGALASVAPAMLYPLLRARAPDGLRLGLPAFLVACRVDLLASASAAQWAATAPRLEALWMLVSALCDAPGERQDKLQSARADALAAALMVACASASKSDKLRAAWHCFCAAGSFSSLDASRSSSSSGARRDGAEGQLSQADTRALLGCLLAGVACLLAPSTWAHTTPAGARGAAAALSEACALTVSALALRLPPGSRVRLTDLSDFYNGPDGEEALPWLELLKLPGMVLADDMQQQQQQQAQALQEKEQRVTVQDGVEQADKASASLLAGTSSVSLLSAPSSSSPQGTAFAPPPALPATPAPTRWRHPSNTASAAVFVTLPACGRDVSPVLSLSREHLSRVGAVASQVGLASSSPRAVLSQVRALAESAAVDVPAFGGIVRALSSGMGGEGRLTQTAQEFLTRALGRLYYVLCDVSAEHGLVAPQQQGADPRDHPASTPLVIASLVALCGGSAPSKWVTILEAADGAPLAAVLSAIVSAFATLSACVQPNDSNSDSNEEQDEDESASLGDILELGSSWQTEADGQGYNASMLLETAPWLPALLGAVAAPSVSAVSPQADSPEKDKENLPPTPRSPAALTPAGATDLSSTPAAVRRTSAPLFSFVGANGEPYVRLSREGCARLLHVAHASGLGRLPPSAVCQAVKAAADSAGCITRRGFQQLCAGWAAGAPVDLGATDTDTDVAVLAAMFDCVRGEDGAASARKVAACVLTLSGGSKSDKLLAGVTLYGERHDASGATPAVIRKEGLLSLLSCFLLAFAEVEAFPHGSDRAARARIARHARSLASSACASRGDGTVSFTELGDWYASHTADAPFFELLNLAKLRALLGAATA